MADGVEVYGVFLGVLEQLGIPYFVTGSVASSAYGEPRFTQNVDLVVSLTPADVRAFVRAFDPDRFYVPPADSLVDETNRVEGGHFDLVHHETGVRADVYLTGEDDLDDWALDHRRRIPLAPGLETWLAPPEYVVIRKLEWLSEGGGERHRDDIRHLIRILGPALDLGFVEQQVRRRALEDAWARVRP